MAVPQSKAELTRAVTDGYDRLVDDLQRVPADAVRELTMPGHAQGTLMSPADLVAYLIGWNELVLSWHAQRAAGVEPAFPAEGYRWNQLGELAGSFYTQCADLSWSELLDRFDRAEKAILALIDRLDDAALYGAPWYGTHTAGRMIQFNTSSPYANARTRLRRWLREREAAEHAAGR